MEIDVISPSTARNTAEAAALLPPAELLRLGNLDFVARMVVEGFLAGRHRSPARGGSLEFAEHRAYAPGDDPRRVDWKVYGRTDRWYVRESEEETNLRATLLVDASASMAFASAGQVTKWEYARAVAAAIAHMLLSQQDAVGVAVFADSLHAFVPPPAARRSPRRRSARSPSGCRAAGSSSC